MELFFVSWFLKWEESVWEESKGVEENVFTTHFYSGYSYSSSYMYRQMQLFLIQFTDVLHEYYTNVAHYTNFQKKSL